MIGRTWSSVRLLPAVLAAMGAVSPSQAQVGAVRPPLGAMVDIGGRRLHLYCTGSGSPTVVLEAGASSFALDWGLVQPQIAPTTRVCSYDRAGYGWSDPSPAGESPAQVARDLGAVLAAAQERPPYVIVGASMGGIYSRIFERGHRSEVAGMVFVDPSHEDRLFVDVAGVTLPVWGRTVDEVRASLAPRAAWPAILARMSPRDPQTGSPFDRLPRDLYDARLEFDRRLIAAGRSLTYDQYVETEVGRQSAFVTLHEQGKADAHALGTRPVVVLTRGTDFNAERVAVHQALAAQSTNSRQTTVAGAGHEIHLFAPAAVVEAILEVVEAARRGTRLRPR
jgi:pimeloyl-ACP methyl ester carboxylesterase